MKRLIFLVRKYQSELLYLIFGGLTTVVDWAISFLLYAMGWNVHVADVLAWMGAVLFAFLTNRIWVFQSRRKGVLPIAGELLAFAGGRVLTLGLQELIVFLFVDLLAWNKYSIKILAAVFVVVANYFISKFAVFRTKKSK